MTNPLTIADLAIFAIAFGFSPLVVPFPTAENLLRSATIALLVVSVFNLCVAGWNLHCADRNLRAIRRRSS